MEQRTEGRRFPPCLKKTVSHPNIVGILNMRRYTTKIQWKKSREGRVLECRLVFRNE
jgi:hypothetical protein